MSVGGGSGESATFKTQPCMSISPSQPHIVCYAISFNIPKSLPRHSKQKDVRHLQNVRNFADLCYISNLATHTNNFLHFYVGVFNFML